MSVEYFVVCDNCKEGGHIGSIIRGGTLTRVHNASETIDSLIRFSHSHRYHDVKIISEGLYFGEDYKEIFSDVGGFFLKEE